MRKFVFASLLAFAAPLAAQGGPAFTAEDVTCGEGDGTCLVAITSNDRIRWSGEVNLQIVGGTSSPPLMVYPRDISSVSGVTFSKNAKSGSVLYAEISIIDDELEEGDEFTEIELTGGARFTVTITDND